MNLGQYIFNENISLYFLLILIYIFTFIDLVFWGADAAQVGEQRAGISPSTMSSRTYPGLGTS